MHSKENPKQTLLKRYTTTVNILMLSVPIFVLDYNEYGCDFGESNGTNSKIFLLKCY